MNIAVNTRLLIKNRLEGIGWYMFENLKRMCVNNPQHTFYFLFDRPFDQDFIFSQNVVPIVLKPQARHPFLYLLWFEFAVSKALKKYKIDVFFSPDGYASLCTKVPTLLTIHDIYFEHNKADFPFLSYHYLKLFIPLFSKKAKLISTVSEFTKNDLIEKYSLEKEKIKVCYNGVGEHFKPASSDKIAKIRKKYSNGFPYFLFIGSLHNRKNIINQLRAFDLFKKQTNSAIKFIVVGKRMWKFKELDKALADLSCKDDIIFIGHKDVKNLIELYQAALVLCFVSKFEGFGIPIVEAFKSGLPVLTSNNSSLPEIAGNAALFVEPENIEEISNAMNLLSSNESLRSKLIDAGLQRVQLFSWDTSANELMQLIEKIAIK